MEHKNGRNNKLLKDLKAGLINGQKLKRVSNI